MLRETASAHHQAFVDTDGEDAEWPLWYAEYLQEKLAGLLKTILTKSELVYTLLAAEKDRMRNAPDAEWTEYYAKYFLER